MPPLLGPADSFNSSSATIRPDKREDDSHREPSMSTGRELGPADSVGRDFESLIAGRAGVLQSENGLGDADLLNRYLNYSSQPAISPTISPSAPGLPTASEFIFGNTQGDVTTDFFAQVGVEQNTSTVPTFNSEYRPSSALSNHSVHSNHSHHSHRSRHSFSSTEVSDYTTTDMDTDQEWQQPSPSPLAEMGQLNIGSWTNGPSTISPDAEGLGSSSRRRRRTTEEDEPEPETDNKRLQKLEHRRSINRRSAQKHRLRRKEELESLTKTVAEKDAVIAALRQELAVTRARMNTMIEMMKSQGMIQRDVKE